MKNKHPDNLAPDGFCPLPGPPDLVICLPFSNSVPEDAAFSEANTNALSLAAPSSPQAGDIGSPRGQGVDCPLESSSSCFCPHAGSPAFRAEAA